MNYGKENEQLKFKKTTGELKKEIPIEQICDQLKEYECALIAQDTYFNFKYNEVTDKLAKLSNQNARRETFTL